MICQEYSEYCPNMTYEEYKEKWETEPLSDPTEDKYDRMGTAMIFPDHADEDIVNMTYQEFKDMCIYIFHGSVTEKDIVIGYAELQQILSTAKR